LTVIPNLAVVATVRIPEADNQGCVNRPDSHVFGQRRSVWLGTDCALNRSATQCHYSGPKGRPDVSTRRSLGSAWQKTNEPQRGCTTEHVTRAVPLGLTVRLITRYPGLRPGL